MQGTYHSGEGGESLRYDPGSELRLEGSKTRRAKITSGMVGGGYRTPIIIRKRAIRNAAGDEFQENKRKSEVVIL